MNRSVLLLHAAFIGAAAAVFSGCPSEECDTPVSIEVTDPSLGEHEGTLTWLQTGVEAKLRLTATAADSATAESCYPSLDVEYTLVSTDGAIEQSFSTHEYVTSEGTFQAELDVVLEPKRPLEAGVAPDLPDLLDREPILTLYLERAEGGYAEGVIRAVTATDNVALATVSFARTP
jgi:hypothetical protein